MKEIEIIQELNKLLSESTEYPVPATDKVWTEADHPEPDGDEDEFGNEPEDHDEDEEEVEEVPEEE